MWKWFYHIHYLQKWIDLRQVQFQNAHFTNFKKFENSQIFTNFYEFKILYFMTHQCIVYVCANRQRSQFSHQPKLRRNRINSELRVSDAVNTQISQSTLAALYSVTKLSRVVIFVLLCLQSASANCFTCIVISVKLKITQRILTIFGASLQHAISRDPKDIIFLRVQGTCWCTDAVVSCIVWWNWR